MILSDSGEPAERRVVRIHTPYTGATVRVKRRRPHLGARRVARTPSRTKPAA